MKFNIHTVTGALCSSFFATLTIAPGSYSIVAIALSLLALLYFPFTWRNLKNKDVLILSLSLASYFIIYLFSMMIHSEGARELDLPSRTILAILALCLIIRYPPKLEWIAIAISIGSIISGTIALYYVYVLDMRPWYGLGSMVIQIGGICAWLCCLSLAFYFYLTKAKDIVLAELSLFASALASVAALLSGARGSWLLTPFILACILYKYRELITLKVAAKLSLYASIVLLICTPQILSRTSLAIDNISEYKEMGVSSPTSSVGLRIDMWKSALLTFSDHPLIGVGHDNIQAIKITQFEQGNIGESVLKYERAHNQFFEELQTKGLLGILGLSFSFITPLVYFLSKGAYSKKSHDEKTKVLSLLGIVHIVSIFGFSLTQHYLNHHSGIIVFAFGTAIIAGTLIGHNNESKAL